MNKKIKTTTIRTTVKERNKGKLRLRNSGKKAEEQDNKHLQKNKRKDL